MKEGRSFQLLNILIERINDMNCLDIRETLNDLLDCGFTVEELKECNFNQKDIEDVIIIRSEEGEDIPIGTVLSSGKNLDDFLPCVGQIVNIIDYPTLAEYFKEQFGNSAVFGGDGKTTVGLPNLGEDSIMKVR